MRVEKFLKTIVDASCVIPYSEPTGLERLGKLGNMQPPLIEKALEIALKRRRLLSEIRDAIRANDRDLVFDLARKLTGLSDEECCRTDPRLN